MAATDSPQRKKRLPWRRWLFFLLATPIVIVLLYTAFVLSWSYSTGERAGYVQNFSKRGWLFKTWEGELAIVTIPGTLVDKFYFSVRQDSVATKINATLDKKVILVYEQHIGIPTTIFGETEYFVTEVRLIDQ
jgi:hypothetical protein